MTREAAHARAEAYIGLGIAGATAAILGPGHPPRLGASALEKALRYDKLLSTDPPAGPERTRATARLRKNVKDLVQLIEGISAPHLDALDLLDLFYCLGYGGPKWKAGQHSRILSLSMSSSDDGSK